MRIQSLFQRTVAESTAGGCGAVDCRWLDSGLGDESSSHVQVGDDDVDPSAAQRCPYCGELAFAAGYADPAWHSEQLGWADADDALVQFGWHEHAVFIKEA